jgi:hypothetical protein
MGWVTDEVTIVDRPDLLPVRLVVQLPEQLVLAVPVSKRRLSCLWRQPGARVEVGTLVIVVMRLKG